MATGPAETAGTWGGRRPGAGRPPGARNNATLAREAGAESVAKLVRVHTAEALAVLVAVANDADEPGRARVAAASAILDRAHGKPAQSKHVEVEQVGADEILIVIPHNGRDALPTQ